MACTDANDVSVSLYRQLGFLIPSGAETAVHVAQCFVDYMEQVQLLIKVRSMALQYVELSNKTPKNCDSFTTPSGVQMSRLVLPTGVLNGRMLINVDQAK